MDEREYLVDFAKWLDAGASTVVGDPADLADAYLKQRTGGNNMIPGNTLASGR